jgi:hypothetical protein
MLIKEGIKAVLFLKIRLHGSSMALSYDYLKNLLAPHTSGPRDVPRCGALSLCRQVRQSALCKQVVKAKPSPAPKGGPPCCSVPVPSTRWAASGATSKDTALQGGVGETAATLYVKLCDLPAWWWWHHTAISPFLFSNLFEPPRKILNLFLKNLSREF